MLHQAFHDGWHLQEPGPDAVTHTPYNAGRFPPTFANIPAEVQVRIAQHVGDGSSVREKKKNYSTLCQISTSWNAAATPFLYQSFSNEGSSKTLTQFLTTVAQGPALAKCIRDLRLERWHSTMMVPSQKALLAFMLRVLLFTGGDQAELYDTFRAAINHRNFRKQAAMLMLIATRIENLSIVLNEPIIFRGMDWNEPEVFAYIISQGQKNARHTFLNNLRSISIELGVADMQYLVIRQETWKMVYAILGISGLQRFSLVIRNIGLTHPQPIIQSFSQIKDLTLQGLYRDICAAHLLDCCSSLERLHMNSPSPFHADDETLTQAIHRHQNSLKTLKLTNAVKHYRNALAS